MSAPPSRPAVLDRRTSTTVVACHDGAPAGACIDCDAVGPVDRELYRPPAPDRGLIDWPTFWTRDRADVDYVIPGLLPEGASASIYSAAGGGKSLLALEWAIGKATGRHILGEPAQTGHVLYIDHEQDAALLEDRLAAMGVDERTDLSRLHYSLLGDWPPLDTDEGGRALVDTARDLGACLVIVDTISRAIAGEENPADTWLRLYRHTVRRLKQAGIAFVRLDHSGKDASKGERGSSAKRSDVDLVFSIETVSVDRINLVRQKNRLHLPGPDVVALRRTTEPLRHVPVTVDVQRERKLSELVATLDRLDVPADAGRTVASRALKAHGIKARNADISLAVARRKAGPPPVPSLREGVSGDRSTERTGDRWGQPGDSLGTVSGRSRGQAPQTPVPDQSGTGSETTCRTCGEPMVADLLGDGRHPGCPERAA